MAIPRVSSGGGFPALKYTLKKAREAGGLIPMYRRLRSRNTCKTCALGMGGMRGGMVNEVGRFPEVCKKSIQAQVADMAGGIPEEFFKNTPIAKLAEMRPRDLERLGRLAFPIHAGPEDTHFSPISWDNALDLAGSALRGSKPEETFFYSSGRASNEAAFLFQLVARAFGTSNIHNCSYFCHSASGVALGKVVGTGTATVVLDDLEKADLAIVAGANPASNHPRLITQLVRLRRRGGKVIIVNPLKELGLVRFRLPSDVRSMLGGSKVSDLYLQPRAGSDIALFKALLKSLIETEGVDQRFVDEHTSGWENVAADIAGESWGTLTSACAITRAEITEVTDIIKRSRRGIFLWAMGLTHHQHGVDTIVALANLAMARGWLGRPGCGLLPIRGHSNVQGVGSVGVAPKLKKAFADKLEEIYGITSPVGVGQDTYMSMEAAAAGRIYAAVLLGGNLFSSNPDRQWAMRALHGIPLSVSLTTTLNEGHILGRGQTAIILPVRARDEEIQLTTQESMFNYVRISEGGFTPPSAVIRSEVEIIAELAQRILPEGRFDWSQIRSHASLREAIGRVVPGYETIRQVDETQSEFQLAGRTFHTPDFPTSDRRAHFHVTPLPDGLGSDLGFQLMTLRSEGQFNSVVYEEEDLYRGNTRRDVVMMAAADAERLGYSEGDHVLVRTDAGTMKVTVSIVDIRSGTIAMYYPEANELVPRVLDPQSRTPAFKSVRAAILSAR